jgi:uncharacterized NAD-dependent epimerase/dehydratase family protein
MSDTKTDSGRKPQAAVSALTIGADNAVAVIGRKWRWCLETAIALGVPVITVRRRPVILAQSFVDALVVAGKHVEPLRETEREESAPTDADGVLRTLGLSRKAGAK